MQANDRIPLQKAQRIGLRKESRKRNDGSKRKRDYDKGSILSESSTHSRKDSSTTVRKDAMHTSKVNPVPVKKSPKLMLQSMIHLF